MTTIQLLSAQPWVDRLGSTLLHFLWQGLLIAAVYAVARRLAARRSPNLRYGIACAALAMMATSFVLTWIVLAPAKPEAVAQTFASPKPLPPAATSHAAAGPFTAALPPAISPQYIPWVVAAWFAGVIALCLRLVAAWISAERLRTTLVRPAPVEWQRSLDRLKATISVSRPIRLLVSARVHTPMVVGWLRPVVLTPIGALVGLPSEQVEALLLHELAHIRRHDYLINVLQSVIEALLFYHPAVWWISGHIRAERELCCDDIAVSVNGDALTYARALVELASTRPVYLHAAMAATGGSLPDRIARLLGHPRTNSRTRSGPGIAAVVILAIGGLAIFAQPAARPKFEVSSIKVATNHGMRWVRPAPGRLTAEAPLQLLIVNAYAVQPFQVVGGPGWVESDWYDVEAKASGNPSRGELFLMLQSLLEDRFQLKIHHDTKELPVYFLEPARRGVKLPPPKQDACAEPPPDAPNDWFGGRMTPPTPGAPLPLPRCGSVRIMLEPGGARMQGGKVPMPELIRMLSMALGRSVVDRTGNTGLFDVNLSFVADQSTPALPPPPPESASEFTGPPLMTAIQQQLGLKLEGGKGPVDVLVIDHVERPTAN